MQPLSTLITERRSAANFLPNHPITEEELEKIFNVVKFAPSAFNLQHTNYVVVLDENVKNKIYEEAAQQYKVKSASAVIFVLGDKKAYEDAARLYEGMKLLGILSAGQYEDMVKDTVAFYESRGEIFQKDEAIRNASLSAMLFMLAAKDQGWDTCPMIGFDMARVHELLQLDKEMEIALMITIGKEKVESRPPRGYRKPLSEFVTYV